MNWIGNTSLLGTDPLRGIIKILPSYYSILLKIEIKIYTILNLIFRFLVPYNERPCLRPSTPEVSSAPRTMW